MKAPSVKKKPGKAPARHVKAPAAPEKNAVRIPKVAALVASKLRRQIISGELREGDKLPSETA